LREDDPFVGFFLFIYVSRQFEALQRRNIGHLPIFSNTFQNQKELETSARSAMKRKPIGYEAIVLPAIVDVNRKAGPKCQVLS
jgi:hypothetical protein